MPITQRDPKLASLGRRACATGIDGGAVLGATAAGIGAVVVWGKLREGAAWRGMDDVEKRVTRFMESPLGWRRIEPVLALISAVSRRNWQSPSMR